MSLDYAGYPARPPSEAEWEDLLVRYEIAPRALRLAVADAEPRLEVLVPLGLLLSAERWAAGVLAAMRDGREVEGGGAGIEGAGLAGVDGLVREYADLRARNFAAVQRRGLEVWEWSAPVPGGRAVTAYQLLNAAVAMDGEMLAVVRAGFRGAGA